MTMRAMSGTSAARHTRAFSLVEAVVSIVIVGVMLAASLQTVGIAKQNERIAGDKCRGMQLAQQLMSEILSQPYDDPEAPGILGLEAGETAGPGRSLFDDVDDYNDWSASPPQSKDGTAIADLAGWSRTVSVALIDPATFAVVPTKMGAKRITVTVKRQTRVVATLTAIRCGASTVRVIPEPPVKQ